MRFTIQGNVPIEAVHEAINCSIVIVDILVHQAKIQVDRADIWVIFATDNFEDIKGLLDEFKSLGVELASMVVQTKVGIAICDSWRVAS